MRPVSIVAAEYLAQNRRLTIAGLGSFMRRSESGEVIFSSFLKIDDGALVELFMDEGATKEQALNHVEAFVEWVNVTISEQGSVELKGLGVISREESGEWSFESELEAVIIESEEAVIESEEAMAEEYDCEQVYHGRRRADPFIIISVLVAVVALGVILYGFFTEWLMGNIVLPEGLDSVMVSILEMFGIYL